MILAQEAFMVGDIQPSDSRIPGRMDFTVEVVRADDRTRTAYLSIVPDARRYSLITHEGKKFYLDKYLRNLISIDEMNDHLAKQMHNLPVFALSPTIRSTPEYAASRRPVIASDLRTGEYTPPTEQALRHKRFEDDPQSRNIAFLSIDICGSTAQRRSDPDSFDRAYKILLRELGTVVGQFNGAILKPTGDGFIALVDYPAFTTQCDAAIDLGLSLLVVLENSINPALEEAGLKPVQIRIGADFGPARTQYLDVPATGFSQSDVASDALNRAVKIEKSCSPNEFRIGRHLYELIHVQWLERAAEVSFDSTGVGIKGYKVYQMR
jgi:class 3 adenylate cyclase